MADVPLGFLLKAFGALRFLKVVLSLRPYTPLGGSSRWGLGFRGLGFRALVHILNGGESDGKESRT